MVMSSKEQKTVLVTGGCGFIGGHTVDALVKLGHEVIVVDDMSAPENDYFHVYRGLRHRMIALEDSELFEFSTQHFDSDSHRIERGD